MPPIQVNAIKRYYNRKYYLLLSYSVKKLLPEKMPQLQITSREILSPSEIETRLAPVLNNFFINVLFQILVASLTLMALS